MEWTGPRSPGLRRVVADQFDRVADRRHLDVSLEMVTRPPAAESPPADEGVEGADRPPPFARRMGEAPRGAALVPPDPPRGGPRRQRPGLLVEQFGLPGG